LNAGGLNMKDWALLKARTACVKPMIIQFGLLTELGWAVFRGWTDQRFCCP
jgi:hypothetical protein